jgi:hypothetical protein
MTGPVGPAAADRGRSLAGDADREQVVEALKEAFVQGRLTRDEFGARAGGALAARTLAELAALTADIPGGPDAAKLARPAVPARRWPLAKATAGSGACLALAFGLILFAANVLDPAGLGNPNHPWSSLCALFAMCLLFTAIGIMTWGVNASVQQRRARRQLPPQAGPGGRAVDGDLSGAAGPGPALPAPGADQSGAELRAQRPRKPSKQRRQVSGLTSLPVWE